MSLIDSRCAPRGIVCALLLALFVSTALQAQTTPASTTVPAASAATATPATCSRNLTASVVAFDQQFFLNRLGAFEATGMMFALSRDVVPISGTTLSPGNVQLRSDKRPRPLVLRMNEGDCLTINFTNYLSPTRKDNDQPNTRYASIHVIGMQLVTSIASDGSNVGANASSLVAPGSSASYKLFAQHEGGYVMYSTDTIGGEGDGSQQSAGLFGAINVEPSNSRWYRSQITNSDLQYAIKLDASGNKLFTADGHPLINYDAVFPAGHPQAGQPVLHMLKGTEIVKSDLTAMITGPVNSVTGQPGAFGANKFPANPELPDRNQPFREFTIIYHDELGAVQAFPEYFDPQSNPAPKGVSISPGLGFTLHSARDSFGINYGVAGIGAEILANRLKVGPEANCTECKYEENFLSSWAVGDPAQIVDVPANALRDANGAVIPGPKATKVLYPDDPSNVYHSYIGDHTKFRILHGGVKEHHIHHQHAHQWVHTPDSDNSSYDDSQAIGPGAAFTLEMTYNGGGNRNQTPGDSIFHCHFYPHFGQGMWSLWRVHDVFESGTELDANGRPAPGSRAYPDGEIAVGTPIPALVPLPTKAMAPVPAAVNIVNGQINVTGTGNPGYPFFVAAQAGHRPSHPPMFTEFDGGLPRHIITGGTYTESHTRLNFDKTLVTASATQIPENGTGVEKAAMAYQAQGTHPSFRADDGSSANFITNGMPAQPGAPFADPCKLDNNTPVTSTRTYQGADVQLDVKYNKAGWHFKQHRMSLLWQDYDATKAGTRAPQPLFFRANSGDCITYKLTNLIPNKYLQDDFQVRTPTDIVGQHIHLVKFDVLSSDGAGNGWNYEEGAFSNQEVQERINAIMAAGGSWTPITGGSATLAAKQHPFFTGPEGLGAQIVVERWYADPTVNNNNQDRTLRTVFTHDHFGPSTHQQAGLYAGLLIEPNGSTWADNETGTPFYTRTDGGPTSWQAIIKTPDSSLSYREFMMEFQDYTLAYRADGTPVNPPGHNEVPLGTSTVLLQPPQNCPGSSSTLSIPPPCPEAISSVDVGTMTVNYRNEPIPLRVIDPSTTTQAAGAAGDLAQVYRSTVTRSDPAFNVQPTFYPALTNDLRGGDPYTPLFRTYQDDKVQVRVLVGAHEEGHNFHVHGTKWLREPSDPRSGWRGSQMMGISEHFEFDLPPLSGFVKQGGSADFLYEPGASEDDQWNGLWGLIRAYNGLRTDLAALPNNTAGTRQDSSTNVSSFSTATTTSKTTCCTASPAADNGTSTTTTSSSVPTAEAVDETSSTPGTVGVASAGTTTTTTTTSETGNPVTASSQPAPGSSYSVCPAGAPVRTFDVTVIPASKLPGGTLVYNSRTTTIGTLSGPLTDPTAIMYVRTNDLTAGVLNSTAPVEPLILRANAGDCINLTLRNHLPSAMPDLAGYDTLPMIVNNFNANQVAPSHTVGLHPEMLAMNVLNSDGINVGINPPQTAGPGHKVSYQWYAGHVRVDATNAIVHTPVEFGSVPLMPADPIKQPMKGAIGAMIIEPQGAKWTEDAGTRASATVTKSDGTSFREFVAVLQNDVNMRWNNKDAVNLLAGEEDPEDTGQAAINYRTEPLWFRQGYPVETPLTGTSDFGDPVTSSLYTKDIDFKNVLSNSQVGGDPQTPIFQAHAGNAIRLHLLQPAGHQRNNIFQIHGHVWEEEPYTTTAATQGEAVSGVTILGTPVVASTVIADQPLSTQTYLVNNPFSEWEGSQMGVGPSSHFDIVPVNGAGGNFSIPGDYLFRTHQSSSFDRGLWGILRIIP